MCCSVGNEQYGGVLFPASHPRVVAVGASTPQLTRAWYSNRGPRLDFVLPAGGSSREATYTTDVRDGPAGKQRGMGKGDFAGFGLTSAANALAAGVAALVLQVNPKLTADEVQHLMRSNTDHIGGEDQYKTGNHSWDFGYGLLNLEKLVEAARPEGR